MTYTRMRNQELSVKLKPKKSNSNILYQPDLIFNEIKNFVLKIDRSAKVKFITGTNPFKSNKSNIYLKELSKSKRLITGKKLEFLSSIGVSDGRYFADDNINIINIGPGSGSEGHKSNEKIINKDLIDYFYLLENFLLKF